jgi:hypothetical protein
MSKRKKQEDCREGVDYIVVPLTDGLIAWVSPDDVPIGRMGWRAKKSGRGQWEHYYASHGYTIGSVRGEYMLHTLVWERANDTKLPDGFLVDHINQDKLDNRRENLRLATRGDNEGNKKKRRTQAGGKTSSGYKGVTKMKTPKDRNPRTKPWRCTITIDKKQKALGCYASEKEAARTYDKAALEHFGEFAYLNFPEEHDHDQ